MTTIHNIMRNQSEKMGPRNCFEIIWQKSVRWQEYLESRLEVEKQLNYVENCMISENTVKVLKVFWRKNVLTLIMQFVEPHFCIVS